MNTQKEYIVVVNGRPYFAVLKVESLSTLIGEAKERFGADSKVEVFFQTVEPYAAESDSSK